MTIARAVGRNTLFTGIARFSTLAAWFVVTPGVLAVLGPERFGFWSILLALGGSLGAVDLGLGVAVTREMARRDRGGDAGSARGLLFRAVLLQVAVAGAIGLLVVASTELVLETFHVPATWAAEARLAVPLAVGVFLVGAVTNLLFAALLGIQRMDRAAFVAVPAATLLAVGVSWATRQPHPLVALTGVQLTMQVLTAIGYAIVLGRLLPGSRPTPTAVEDGRSLRDLVAFGGWVQVNAIFGLMQAHVDKVMLGALLALAPVAAYELGARVTLAALLPPVMFVAALLPAFARAHVPGEPGRLLPFYRASLDPLFAISFLVTGALVALAPWILGAWLATPPTGASIYLAALAVTQLGNLLTGASSTTARAGGVAHLETHFAVIGTVLHIALAYAGLRMFGAEGLLTGTVLGSLLGMAWFVTRMERWLGAGAPGLALATALPFLGATAVAGALGWLVARTVSPAPVGPSAWGGLAAGGIAYLAAFALHLFAFHRTRLRELVARAGRLGAGG